MTYTLSNKTETSADVINEKGKLLGHVRLTEDHEPVWACFEPGFIHIQANGKTADQAAFALIKYLGNRKK